MTTEMKALYKVLGKRRKMTTEIKALYKVLGRRKKITTGLRKAAQSSRKSKAACKKEERRRRRRRRRRRNKNVLCFSLSFVLFSFRFLQCTLLGVAGSRSCVC